jgi:hypothetical protein
MPEKLRQTLMYGFRERTHWWMHEFGGNNDVIANALFHKTSSTFAYTRNLKSALQDEVERAAHALHINCNAVEIISRFTKAAYFEAYHTEMKRLRQSRKAR